MSNNTQELREFLTSPANKMAAISALEKVGKTLGNQKHFSASKDDPETHKRMIELRELRAALINHSRATDNITSDLVTAIEFLDAEMTLIHNQFSLDEISNIKFGSQSANASTAIHDQAGNRIGTMLSNSDLRDVGKVARHLGTSANGPWDSSADMSIGDFFRGVAGMRTPDSVRNALSEGTDSSGGYAVPTVLLPGILSALVPASSLLQAGANVAVLDQPGDSFKIAATDTIPQAAWRSEHGNVAESEPAFRGLTITPRSLAFRFKISRELLQDSTPGLEQALRNAIAQAFAKELDRAGLRGSGTAPEIRGLLNTSGIHEIDMALPDGAPLANYSKFINAARLIKEDDAPAPTAAIMSPREDEAIALFADTTGQPLRRPDALANWKFLTTSQIPTDLTVGASEDCSEIYIGDFSLFTFFMREGVSVQRLNELHAATGEVGFVCHTRVDVAAMYAKAFAVITGVTA